MIRQVRRRARQSLPIVSLQRLSLSDYPRKLCAKVTVPGCNFRCPYCDRADIVLDHVGMETIPERDVLDHLYRVRGYLGGLCIGGGEPTLHNGLLAFVYKVKSLGYSVKIDTNGTRPKRLGKLMEENLVDYISLEVKAPLDRYVDVVRFDVDVKAVEQSIRLIRRGGVDHEFCTTVVPGLVDGDDLEKIAQTLAGSKRFVIQQFKPGNTMCPEYSTVEPYCEKELRVFRDRVALYFAECKLRL